MDILLVDDEDLSREAIRDFIVEQLGHKVHEFRNGLEAWKEWQDKKYPVIISDVKMPVMTGIEFLEEVRNHPDGKRTDFILITGYADMDSAVRALRAGAYDYLQKPVNIEELAALLDKIEEHQTLLSENKELKENFDVVLNLQTKQIQKQLNFYQKAYSNVVGIGDIGIFSDSMKAIMIMCNKLHEDRTVPALIEGETGTGKEIIARKIHYSDVATEKPFVSINCSAISSSLFESELFGYEEGAFTGAKKSGQIGKLELANGGTIFLDEIGEMPLELQPKLLRAIQQQEIYKVGSNKKIKLDIRFICATNKNLLELSKKGLFRSDLYYRLSVAKIFVPPLRDRKEEILPLAQMFLYKFSDSKSKKFRVFSKNAQKILENYLWPGNIRELQNSIERLVLLYDDYEVKSEYLSFLESDEIYNPEKGNIIDINKIVLPEEELNLEQLEIEIVKKALKKFSNNKSKTAEYLRITRSALRSRIKKFEG